MRRACNGNESTRRHRSNNASMGRRQMPAATDHGTAEHSAGDKDIFVLDKIIIRLLRVELVFSF